MRVLIVGDQARTVLSRLLKPLVLAWVGTALPAQTTASLRIEVLDAAGRPSPGAALSLEPLERGESRLLRADAGGITTAAGLLPGIYRLQGQTLQLRADERVHLRLRLEPAQATVSVGDLRAPRTDLHQLGAQRVQDLPWIGAWNLGSSFAFLWRSGLRYSSLVKVSGDNVLAPAASRGDLELPHALSLDLDLDLGLA